MKSLALAVIGHVDHGKTSLVRALTGMDTDRLPEEKARGLSILPGFAYRDFPSGTVDFIDTPGHEDFIAAMVSGTAGARAFLLVVSAVEGIARQSAEHLEIAASLAIGQGLVAISQCDRPDARALGELTGEVEALLRAHGADGTEIVACSAGADPSTGALEAAIDRLITASPPAASLPASFLPIDRVFSIDGHGLVVTGTLCGSPLHVGAQAELRPSGHSAVIRALQSRGEACASAEPGTRVAVNLRGVSRSEVARGGVLVTPGCFPASHQIDLHVSMAASARAGLGHMDMVRALFGACALTASARPLETEWIAPGKSGLVQLRFEREVTAFAGQRCLLRQLSPPATLGGGVILDPCARAFRRRGRAVTRALHGARLGDVSAIARALAEGSRGAGAIDDIARLARTHPAQIEQALPAGFIALGGGYIAPGDAIDALEPEFIDAVETAHSTAPARPGALAGELRNGLQRNWSPALVAFAQQRLVGQGRLVARGGFLADPAHDPEAALSPRDKARLVELEHTLREGGACPPEPGQPGAEGSEPLLDLLVAAGRAVRLYNTSLKRSIVFHADAIEAARARLAEKFPQGHCFTTGEAREALSTTRKYIVPLLEHLDTLGHTVREGDARRLNAV